MPFIDWLQPRSGRAAALKATVMSAVAGLILVVDTAVRVVGGHQTVNEVLALAAAGALFAISGVFLLVRANPGIAAWRPLWAIIPFLAIAAIVALDLLTDDAGFTGLFIFVFPALYAASQLRLRGLAVVSGALLVAVAVVVFRLLPTLDALIAMTYLVGIGLTGTALLYRSVERSSRLVDRLEKLAAVDPLTGLVTRRVLDEATRTALARSPDVGTGMMILDVDHFKQINDEHGHPAGDEVLVQLASSLTRHCRETDVVSRLGGDEIAILFTGITAEDLAGRVAAIGLAVRGLPVLLPDGTGIHLSLSGGAAHAPSHADDHRSLYTAADIALYDAKRAGRDRIVVANGTSRVTVVADGKAIPIPDSRNATTGVAS